MHNMSGILLNNAPCRLWHLVLITILWGRSNITDRKQKLRCWSKVTQHTNDENCLWTLKSSSSLDSSSQLQLCPSMLNLQSYLLRVKLVYIHIWWLRLIIYRRNPETVSTGVTKMSGVTEKSDGGDLATFRRRLLHIHLDKERINKRGIFSIV